MKMNTDNSKICVVMEEYQLKKEPAGKTKGKIQDGFLC